MKQNPQTLQSFSRRCFIAPSDPTPCRSSSDHSRLDLVALCLPFGERLTATKIIVVPLRTTIYGGGSIPPGHPNRGETDAEMECFQCKQGHHAHRLCVMWHCNPQWFWVRYSEPGVALGCRVEGLHTTSRVYGFGFVLPLLRLLTPLLLLLLFSSDSGLVYISTYMPKSPKPETFGDFCTS